MPQRHERPKKMADSQTFTKLSKKESSLRFLGYTIISLLVLGMLVWTIRIFLF